MKNNNEIRYIHFRELEKIYFSKELDRISINASKIQDIYNNIMDIIYITYNKYNNSKIKNSISQSKYTRYLKNRKNAKSFA